jgi:CBS domain-containing protein
VDFELMATTQAAAPLKLRLGDTLRQKAHQKSTDIMNQVLSILEKRVEDEAEQGNFEAYLSLDDFGRQYSEYLRDPKFQALLDEHLRNQDLLLDIFTNDNNTVLHITWGPVGGVEGEEIDEEEMEEEEEDFDYEEDLEYEIPSSRPRAQPFRAGKPSAQVPQQPAFLQHQATQISEQSIKVNQPSASVAPRKLAPPVQQQTAQATSMPGPSVPSTAVQPDMTMVQQPPPHVLPIPLIGTRRAPPKGVAAPLQRRGGPQVEAQPTTARPGRIINPRLTATPVPVPEPYPKTLRYCLSNIPVRQIMVENWVNKRLVLVGDHQSVEKALGRLNRHNILSLPVLDETTGCFIGVLDSMGLVQHLTEVFDTRAQRGGYTRWSFVFKNIRQLMDQLNEKTMTIASQASVLDGLQELAKGTKRLMVSERTSPIVSMQQDYEPTCMGLLTGSDIIRWLGEHPNWMDTLPVARKTVGELDLGSKKIISVNEDMAAFEAFKVINDNKIHGIAVTDKLGRLVANLSASNIRSVTRNNFQILFSSVYEYLGRDRRRGWWKLPICVHEFDSLFTVILQFASTKVHQMYVTDAQGKPYRVITHTDVLRPLMNAMEGISAK